MSARLNMNEIRPIAWKGQTFNQVMSGIKMNKKTLSTNNHNLFLPQPMEHYRREIASDTSDKCSRTSINIDVLLQPGGSIVNSASANANNTGVGNMTVDFNLTNDSTEKPGSCVGICSDRASDARRRVRSAGMITKKPNPDSNNDTYYTSTNQYLVNRNRTFQQNQYVHFRYGDRTLIPGAPGSSENIYTPNGINHCAEVQISAASNNNSFDYYWLDGERFTITFPDGNYNIDELNTYFHGELLANYHYIIDTTTDIFFYLFNFVYDTATDRVQIQCFAADQTIFQEPRYLRPQYVIDTNEWIIPEFTLVPNIEILVNGFQNVIGFNSGLYPPADINAVTLVQPSTAECPDDNIYYAENFSDHTYTYYVDYPNTTQGGNQFFTGINKPKIGTPYVPLYYKPSNSKFATQGGVDSSSRLSRLKYDTITTSANSFRTAFGNQTANSLAYGVPNPGPTQNMKDKMGYPQTCSPAIDPRTGEINKCKSTRIGW